MVGFEASSGTTFWIIWMRKPRLKSAVVRVAVETVLSLSRVAGSSAMVGPWECASKDGRLFNRLAEPGLEEVEVAALVGLLDVAREHPAVAALVAGLLWRQGGAASGQLRLRHLHADRAGG